MHPRCDLLPKPFPHQVQRGRGPAAPPGLGLALALQQMQAEPCLAAALAATVVGAGTGRALLRHWAGRHGEPQNREGWRRPLRSSSPTIIPTPPHLLSHVLSGDPGTAGTGTTSPRNRRAAPRAVPRWCRVCPGVCPRGCPGVCPRVPPGELGLAPPVGPGGVWGIWGHGLRTGQWDLGGETGHEDGDMEDLAVGMEVVQGHGGGDTGQGEGDTADPPVGMLAGGKMGPVRSWGCTSAAVSPQKGTPNRGGSTKPPQARMGLMLTGGLAGTADPSRGGPAHRMTSRHCVTHSMCSFIGECCCSVELSPSPPPSLASSFPLPSPAQRGSSGRAAAWFLGVAWGRTRTRPH